MIPNWKNQGLAPIAYYRVRLHKRKSYTLQHVTYGPRTIGGQTMNLLVGANRNNQTAKEMVILGDDDIVYVQEMHESLKYGTLEPVGPKMLPPDITVRTTQ